MIPDAIGRAIGQIGDPRFRRVLVIGIALTIGLLVAVYAALFWIVQWVTPDSFTLPWIGEVTWIDNILSGASLILMLVASVFLMVPVASMFTSIFLDDVTDAVEAEHYPHLAPAPRLGVVQGLVDGVKFLGVIIAANLAALVVYLVVLPAGPAIFVALNGYLLGREYFQLIALRRLGPEGARTMRRRHAATIWLTGAIMALPLTIPIVNLVIPVIGAAAFTHLFHSLEGASGRRSPDPSR